MTEPNALNSTPTAPNDTAFPAQFEDNLFTEGLTKREYFAAIAMQGIVGTYDHRNFTVNYEDIAATAVQCANALIKALSKES